ncbi:MAG: hypothetical protein KAH04_07115, partial [Psychrilyobacter sp.]|nr:hypothetical protein [Psychrilyobacter sp.]
MKKVILILMLGISLISLGANSTNTEKKSNTVSKKEIEVPKLKSENISDVDKLEKILAFQKKSEEL